jgi:MinD superfamily P-loop ATPase
VLINRSDVGDRAVHTYCHESRIKIMAEIPDDRRIAEAYSRGELVCEALPDYAASFARLLQEVAGEVASPVRI